MFQYVDSSAYWSVVKHIQAFITKLVIGRFEHGSDSSKNIIFLLAELGSKVYQVKLVKSYRSVNSVFFYLIPVVPNRWYAYPRGYEKPS